MKRENPSMYPIYEAVRSFFFLFFSFLFFSPKRNFLNRFILSVEVESGNRKSWFEEKLDRFEGRESWRKLFFEWMNFYGESFYRLIRLKNLIDKGKENKRIYIGLTRYNLVGLYQNKGCSRNLLFFLSLDFNYTQSPFFFLLKISR